MSHSLFILLQDIACFPKGAILKEGKASFF